MVVKKFISVVLLVVMVALSGIISFAQEENFTAEDIILNAAEVYGGKQNFEKIQCYTIEATQKDSKGELQRLIRIYFKRPASIRMECTDLINLTKWIGICSPKEKTGKIQIEYGSLSESDYQKFLSDMRKSLIIYPFLPVLGLLDNIDSCKFIREENRGGKNYYIVELSHSKNRFNFFFGKESMRLAKYVHTKPQPSGAPLRMEWRYSKEEIINGIKIPMVEERFEDGAHIRTRHIDEISFDELDDNIFGFE